jgi:hypothetical protein
MSGFIQTYQDKIKKGKAPGQTPHRLRRVKMEKLLHIIAVQFYIPKPAKRYVETRLQLLVISKNQSESQPCVGEINNINNICIDSIDYNNNSFRGRTSDVVQSARITDRM